MHFVYTKELTLASQYNYDSKLIINWLIDNINVLDYFEEYGSTLDPDYLIDLVFDDVDTWYDDFVEHFNIEQDVKDNLSCSALIEQLDNEIRPQLVEYYKLNWKEFKELYNVN